MDKQAALLEAEKYAALIKRGVYVLRRGSKYKVSQNEIKGWAIAEIIVPNEIVLSAL